MPSFVTDFEAGQKAAYNFDLNPLRAQAEADLIPVKVEEEKQKLVKDKQENERSKITLQNLIQTTGEDKEAKVKIQALYADPEFKTKTVAQQTEAVGRVLTEAGQFDKGVKWFDESGKAQARDESAKASRDKHQDRVMDNIYGFMQSATPENLDAQLLALQNAGVLKPEEIAKLAKDAKAAAQNPATWKQYKTAMQDTHKSLKLREELRKEEVAKAANELATRRLEETERKNRALEAKGIAALNAGTGLAANRLFAELGKGIESSIQHIDTKINQEQTQRKGIMSIELNQQKEFDKIPVVTAGWFNKAEVGEYQAKVKERDIQKRSNATRVAEFDIKVKELEKARKDAITARGNAIARLTPDLKATFAATVPPTPSIETTSISVDSNTQDDEAVKWAKDHPKDPRSAAVLKKVEAKTQSSHMAVENELSADDFSIEGDPSTVANATKDLRRRREDARSIRGITAQPDILPSVHEGLTKGGDTMAEGIRQTIKAPVTAGRALAGAIPGKVEGVMAGFESLKKERNLKQSDKAMLEDVIAYGQLSVADEALAKTLLKKLSKGK